MNKGHLIDRISASSGCNKTQAATAIETMVDSITAALKKGERVTIVGFGTFNVSQRKARNGRNPQTGSLIKIAARRVAKFTPGIELKKAVGRGKYPQFRRERVGGSTAAAILLRAQLRHGRTRANKGPS